MPEFETPELWLLDKIQRYKAIIIAFAKEKGLDNEQIAGLLENGIAYAKPEPKTDPNDVSILTGEKFPEFLKEKYAEDAEQKTALKNFFENHVQDTRIEALERCCSNLQVDVDSRQQAINKLSELVFGDTAALSKRLEETEKGVLNVWQIVNELQNTDPNWSGAKQIERIEMLIDKITRFEQFEETVHKVQDARFASIEHKLKGLENYTIQELIQSDNENQDALIKRIAALETCAARETKPLHYTSADLKQLINDLCQQGMLHKQYVTDTWGDEYAKAIAQIKRALLEDGTLCSFATFTSAIANLKDKHIDIQNDVANEVRRAKKIESELAELIALIAAAKMELEDKLETLTNDRIFGN